MFKNFYPYEYSDSVFTVDYKKLYEMGYRGLIFDIDNTLVHHGADSTPETDRFLGELQAMGFKIFILTDNDEQRVKRFLKNIEADYICDAEKPKTESFLNAVSRLGTEKDKIIYIGDQIFTDIYGANKSGIKNILVRFLRRSGDTRLGIKRNIEKVILFFYSKSRRYKNRLGDILTENDSSKNKVVRK